jgi:alpha-beta hydrolase superfamily lysophospholipase
MVSPKHTVGHLLFTAMLLAFPMRIIHAQSSFYWPKPGTPRQPRSEDYSVHSVTIPNQDATLAGWVLEPKSADITGTVVYCHGNAGNMEHHVAFVDYLPRHGFRVLMFDYQGYGESTPNHPTRASTASDVNAAVDFAIARWGRSWLMGQSLGASLAISTAGERARDLQGIVAVAPFTSYRAMARAVLRRSILTRALVLPSYVIVRGGHDPIDVVGNIAPTPILLVHGERDELIPPRMSRELFEKARSPKDLLFVPDAAHNSTWREMGPVYVDKVIDFLTRTNTDGYSPPIPAARRSIGSPSTLSR